MNMLLADGTGAPTGLFTRFGVALVLAGMLAAGYLWQGRVAGAGELEEPPLPNVELIAAR